MEVLVNTGIGAILIACLLIFGVIFTRALEHRLLKWIFATAMFLFLAWSMGGVVRVAWELHRRLHGK